MVARLLGARLNAEVVSVPSAATAEVEHSTHLGKRLQDAPTLPDRRSLLPSSLVAPLVMPRLERYATQTSGAARPVSLILSNFPRTNDQLTMLQRCALPVEPTILHLMMSREDAEARLAARRVCATCGEPMYPLEAATGASPPPGGGGTLHAHLVEDASAAMRRGPLDRHSTSPRRLARGSTPTTATPPPLWSGCGRAVARCSRCRRRRPTLAPRGGRSRPRAGWSPSVVACTALGPALCLNPSRDQTKAHEGARPHKQGAEVCGWVFVGLVFMCPSVAPRAPLSRPHHIADAAHTSRSPRTHARADGGPATASGGQRDVRGARRVGIYPRRGQEATQA